MTQSQTTKKKKQKEESSIRKKSESTVVAARIGITLNDLFVASKVMTSHETVHPDKENAIIHEKSNEYMSAEDNYDVKEIPKGDGKTVDGRLATERLEKKTTFFDDREWVTMTDNQDGVNWQPNAYEHNIDHLVPVTRDMISTSTHSFPGDVSRHNTIRQRRLVKEERCIWTRIDRIMEYNERTYERDSKEIKLYRVRGADFTEEEFLTYFVDEDFTPESVISLWNVEQKSAIINEHGFEKIFKEEAATEIHRHNLDDKGKQLEYRLYELTIDKVRQITARILRVQDYSTGKFAYLGVPRTALFPAERIVDKIKDKLENESKSELRTSQRRNRRGDGQIEIKLDTCMKAVAWTFGMTEEEYKPLVET